MSMMFIGEHYFQTLGGMESKHLFLILYYFSCGDIIKDKSAGRFSPLEIDHRTLVGEFNNGRNRKFQTKYRKSGAGSKPLRNEQLGAPVDFYADVCPLFAVPW